MTAARERAICFNFTAFRTPMDLCTSWSYILTVHAYLTHFVYSIMYREIRSSINRPSSHNPRYHAHVFIPNILEAGPLHLQRQHHHQHHKHEHKHKHDNLTPPPLRTTTVISNPIHPTIHLQYLNNILFHSPHHYIHTSTFNANP